MSRSSVEQEIREIFSKARPARPRWRTWRTLILLIAGLVAAGSAWAAYAHLTAPTGRITAPVNGAMTDRLVEIHGYTKNLPIERRFIWVAVDVPDLGLCWPKRPVGKFNEPFKTKLFEQGPNRKFVVSLYAVDKDYNNEILKWQQDCRRTRTETGLAMLPKQFRLDSLTLMVDKG